MKKLIAMGLTICAASFAQAETAWSWWLDNPAKVDYSFGIANKCASVESFELSLIYSASPVKSAMQWSFLGINNADSDCVLQLALANLGSTPGIQLGFINLNKEPKFDMGFCNVSDDTKVQLGFLNFNKKGFLPVFPFINFDPSIFD